MTDTNAGTAVGDFGAIVRTTDGGATWVAQDSGTQDLLIGVSMTDANTGTAVGTSGDLIRETSFRTTDGGATWVTQESGPGMNGFFELRSPPGCDAGHESTSIPLDLVTYSEGIFGLLDCGTLNFRGEGETSRTLRNPGPGGHLGRLRRALQLGRVPGERASGPVRDHFGGRCDRYDDRRRAGEFLPG